MTTLICSHDWADSGMTLCPLCGARRHTIVGTLTYGPSVVRGDDTWRDLCESAYAMAHTLTDTPEDITPIEYYGEGVFRLGVTLRDGSHGLITITPDVQ